MTFKEIHLPLFFYLVLALKDSSIAGPFPAIAPKNVYVEGSGTDANGSSDPIKSDKNQKLFPNKLSSYPTEPGSLGIWDQYSCSWRDGPEEATKYRSPMRFDGLEKANGSFADSRARTPTYTKGIGTFIENALGTGSGYRISCFAQTTTFKVAKENFFWQSSEKKQSNFRNS